MLDELSHTNIVKYIDFKFDAIYVDNDGNEEHIAYMVMELAEGGGLIDKIMDEPFSEEICRYYFKQMLSAIHHCHTAGIVHLDLKPDNILLDSNWGIKIADFGLAGLL